MRMRLVTWLGVALSVAVVAWMVTRFDLRQAADALRMADPWWLLLAALLYTLLFPLRGYRWSLLLRPLKADPISARTATELFLIGFMANNMLPARLGDVARAVLLGRREGVSRSAAFSNVMLERVFDGVVVVAFLNVVLWLWPLKATWLGHLNIFTALLFGGAIIVSGLVAWNDRLVLQVTRRLLSWLPHGILDKLVALIEKLSMGLHALKSPSQTIGVLTISVAIWSLETSVYVATGHAFGLDVPLHGYVLAMCVLTLGLTMPTAPGFIGVFEALVMSAVKLYGVVEETALAFGLAVHLVHYVPGTILGLVLAWHGGIKLRALQADIETAPPIEAK